MEHDESIGLGHAWHPDFISDDEACAELVAKAGDPTLTPRIHHWNCGRRREAWSGPVIAVGDASGFVEPLASLRIQQLIVHVHWLARVLALAGAAFLAVYGWQALRRARQASQLTTTAGAEGAPGLSLCAALAQAAAFTLLNPHVYLDTVLLVGSIGAQQPPGLQGWFVAGASAASLLWFCALGFGARWLAPLFARPRAWQVLDGLIGVTMGVLSALLVRHAVWAN